MNGTRIAAELLGKEAVKLSPDRKFVWASGIHSPVYCDNRKLLSFPETRKLIGQMFAEVVTEQFPDTEVIAGVATGAVAWGLLVAENLNLPFIYVRSDKKKHGLGNRIEGLWPKGKKVLVIEDLVSTGGSSLSAVEALRSAEAQVLGMAAIFTYLLPEAKKNFNQAQCPLVCLSDFKILMEEAVRRDYVTDKEAADILSWHAAF